MGKRLSDNDSIYDLWKAIEFWISNKANWCIAKKDQSNSSKVDWFKNSKLLTCLIIEQVFSVHMFKKWTGIGLIFVLKNCFS